MSRIPLPTHAQFPAEYQDRLTSAFSDLDLGSEEGLVQATSRLVSLVLEGVIPLDKAEFVRKCLDDLRSRRSVGNLGDGSAVLAVLSVQRERPKPRFVLDAVAIPSKEET